MDQFNILRVMEEKYRDDDITDDLTDDLYTFGGVIEYDLIEEDKMEDKSGGTLIEDGETDGKLYLERLYLDDMPELDDMLNKKEGGSNNVKQAEFLAFLNKLARLEK